LPGYDPIRLGETVAGAVCEGRRRRYYRFRASRRWYGGIVTADVVGCNLRCVFCWSFRHISNLKEGELLLPEEVSARVRHLVGRTGIRKVRISGGEPTICFSHLMDVMMELYDLDFILETNGLLIGKDDKMARSISELENVYVRISLKGTTKDEFSRLTGADGRYFDLQMRAIDNLARHGVPFHVSAMISFSPEENVRRLISFLEDRGIGFEPELLIAYPSVMARLRKAGIKPLRVINP